MQIPEIKNRLPITKVLAHYGIKPDKNNHIKCPFHQDDKPSCKIYLDTNTFHCFGCGATGDQVEFCVKMEGDKHKGILKAAELAGEIPEETIQKSAMGIASSGKTAKEADQAKEQANYNALFDKFKESLPRSPKALEYLKQRRLLSEAEASATEVGYNSGSYYNKLKECITFPLKDKTGNIVSLYGRRIYDGTPGSQQSHSLEFGRHYYTQDRHGLYPGYPSPEAQTLIITEAIIDAASLQLAINNEQWAIKTGILAAYGTNGLTTEHKAAMAGLKHLREVIFFFDGDTAGREGAARYSEELSKDNTCIVSVVPTPEGEDINSMFVAYGKDSLIELINGRKPINGPSFSIEKASIENPLQPQSLAAPSANSANVQAAPRGSLLDTDTPNKIIYETATARYIIKGSLPKTFDRMVVSLDVQCLETGTKYRCRLELYEEKQTRKEARERFSRK